MIDYTPVRFEGEDGTTLWQPAFPDGTRLYYEGDKLVFAPDYYADRHGFTPATCRTHRKAVKMARVEWKRRIKEHFGEDYVG